MDTTRIVVGTAEGVFTLNGEDGRPGEPASAPALGGRSITAVAPRATAPGWLVLVDGSEVWTGGQAGDWDRLAVLDEGGGTCLAESRGDVLVGTVGAGLLRVDGSGARSQVAGFDRAEGRDRWYTPWGGPPDTRSIAVSPEGDLFVNVHVGGILRHHAGEWTPTLDIDNDVHQVVALGGGRVLAACALGLARSDDDGRSWELEAEGLHGRYSRALAVSGDWLLVSASTGPRTDRAAVYRRPLAGHGPFEASRAGLPEWFGANVDTGHLAAAGAVAAVATPDGSVFVSTDSGQSWALTATGLPAISSVAVAGPGGAA